MRPVRRSLPNPNRRLAGPLLAAIVSTLPATAWAHPESISSIEVLIRNSGTTVSLTLQTRDLDRWFPPANHPDYKAYVLSGLRQHAGELFEFQADGQAVSPADVQVAADKPGCVRVALVLKLPAGAQSLVVRTTSLDKLPPGHKQLLCAEDERAIGKPGESPPILVEQALTADEDSTEISLADTASARPMHPRP